MAELPRYFSENVVENIELLEEARGVILDRVAEGPIEEDELLQHVGQSLHVFTDVGLVALSSLDGLYESKGIISVTDPR